MSLVPPRPVRSSPGSRHNAAADAEVRWWPAWAAVTLFAAGLALALDVLLLQARRSYFTGGFLSVDHTRSVAEGALFVVVSFAADVALPQAKVPVIDLDDIEAIADLLLKRAVAVDAAEATAARSG